MRVVRTAPVSLVLVATCFGLNVLWLFAQEPAHPQARLETAIAEGVRLLEKKDYRTFCKNFIAPDDLAEIQKSVTLSQLAEDFGKSGAERLLRVLKSIQGKQPELDNSGQTARFEVDESLRLPSRQHLVFVRIGGLWYIRN